VNIGDDVFIQKAGEIIPQVVGVAKRARADGTPPFEMPSSCPECGTKVVARLREEGKPELGAEATVRCPNRGCPAQVRGRILYFASRPAMAIDHLGESLVDQLVGKRLVHSVPELYDLGADQVAALERMGKKSAQNVVTSIAASKERTLDRVLTGLGIPQIGQVAAKQLAEVVGTLEELVALSAPERIDELRAKLEGIHGFGPKMVDSVIDFVREPIELATMKGLLERGVGRPQPREVVATDGPLVGKSFCVTGVLTRKREEVHALLRAAGATVHDSVKKDTTYLVAGDKTGKTKLDQAKKYGARVVSEDEMDLLLSGGSLPG
jgi:DNA ligase (NAD+)